jgi:hypothetical protein
MKKKSVEMRALELAMLRYDGDCPLDNLDVLVDCGVNGDKCHSDGAKCWKKYFIRLAKKEMDKEKI